MSTPSAYGGSANVAIPKFDSTLGAILIGGLVAMGLWGVTCVQTFTFFTSESKDSRPFKFMIFFLWALDTFDSALNGHILYFYLVTNYLNPVAIQHPVWSIIIHVAITSISDFFIRTIFALRFYRLSHGNTYVTAFIMAVSTADLVIGLVITAKAFSITSYEEINRIQTLYYLIFATSATSDFSVALSLCFLLLRSRTGFKSTDSLIKTLVIYTVNTGLIVAIDASLSTLMYALMPRNFVWLGFYLQLSKLYLNCYLATLNARNDLRQKNDEPVSIHLSKMWRSRHRYDPETPPATIEKGNNSEQMSISIQTRVEKQMDRSNNPSGSA